MVAVQSVICGQPDRPVRVFAHLKNRAFEAIRIGWKMGEAFGSRIIEVEKLITSDPEFPGPILEECVHLAAAQAVGIVGIISEFAKPITIVASQAILSPKPDEALIV